MAQTLVDFLGLKILRADHLGEAQKSALLPVVDLVELSEYQPSGFWRPLKISWRMDFGRSPLIGQIASRRARKQIKIDSQRIINQGIRIESQFPLERNVFLKWLDCYRINLSGKQRPRLLVDENWLADKEESGKKVGGVFAWEEGKMLGGNLFYQLGQRLSIAYGIASKVSGLTGGLGLLLDYNSLVFAKKSGFPTVSLGQDTNLYGFHLSPGLLFYKTKLGFRPIPATKTEWRTTYFLNFEKFRAEPESEKIILFFSGQEKLILNCLHSKTAMMKEIDLPLGVVDYQIYSQEKILSRHREVLNA